MSDLDSEKYYIQCDDYCWSVWEQGEIKPIVYNLSTKCDAKKISDKLNELNNQLTELQRKYQNLNYSFDESLNVIHDLYEENHLLENENKLYPQKKGFFKGE